MKNTGSKLPQIPAGADLLAAVNDRLRRIAAPVPPAVASVDPGTVATSPAITPSTVAGVAGAIYGGPEQVLLNGIVTTVNSHASSLAALKVQVDNLIADRDRLRAILKARGLMT